MDTTDPKEAAKARRRVYSRRHRAKYIEQRREQRSERGRIYRAKTPEKQRQYYINSGRESNRAAKLKAKYGITENDYTTLLVKQGGRCAICKTDKIGKGRRHFAVDHCHETGKVRGLLCDRCNKGLGYFCDDITLLEVATTYLQHHKN